MRIGIDAREIQHGVSTGIGRALDNFLRWFGVLDDEHRCFLFSEEALPIEYGQRIVHMVSPAAPLTVFWDQTVLPRLIKRHGIDLFYSPYYKVPLVVSVPMISTIFDLMYIFYPVAWRGTGCFSRPYYRVFGGMMAARARRIFTCSAYSKKEIVRFYRVAAEKVEVIHLGLSEQYRRLDDAAAVEAVKRTFNITSPYLLYTGNFKPHKNVAALLDAFEMIRETVPRVMLVLAGNNDRYFEPASGRIRRCPHAAAIVATGRITQDEQVALYNGASVFVCPSLYEGFGYPPLEAMACGAPVVSSGRTSLNEIIGDAALRCDPTDAADIAEKTVALLQNGDLRRQCIDRGLERARIFTNAAFCERFYAMLLSRR